jgi:hypothetical protein
MPRFIATAPLFVALAVGLAGCSGTKSIQSVPLGSPPEVDGSVSDWEGAVQPVEERDGLALGVTNDGEALYVSLIVRDQELVRQIARDGLVLWLDPEGGKRQQVGVQYPLGLAATMGPGARGRMETMGGVDARSGARENPGGLREALRERFLASLDELMLLREGEATGARIPTPAPTGLSASATMEFGEMIVEYRIPLGDGLGGSLAAAPGAQIGVGLVTPERERPGLGAGRGGGLGDASQGGMGGARRGGMGGQRGQGAAAAGRTLAQSEPLTLWRKVDLAQ